MAKKGKRGGFRVRTRTIVKYRNRAVAVAKRARHHGTTLAKERLPVTVASAIIGWADAKRDQANDQLGVLFQKIPAIGGQSWLATAGVALHFYHKHNRKAKWADRAATAALSIAGFKAGRGYAGVSGVGGNGNAGGVWMQGPAGG